MENQGFEAEQPSRSEGPTMSREPLHDSQAFPFEFVSSSSSNADGHVYEVIMPSIEDTSKHVEEPNRLPLNVADYVSRETTARSSDEIAFRRNLTLPFRRGTGREAAATSASVRVPNRSTSGAREEDVSTCNAGLVVFADDGFPFRETSSATTQSTVLQPDCRPNRRRRKKDCKHCRSKAAAFANARELGAEDAESEAVLRRNRDNEQAILDTRNFTTLAACSANGKVDEIAGCNTTAALTISEKASPVSAMKFIDRERNGSAETNEDNVLIGSGKNQPEMRVNSIYSQDRWYAKEAPIFFTDVKEHGTFQRAYSLPVRTQTPSSQNRINLRRSVRGEPPPHPARLRKHRHGWTLHLAHPLEASGCTRSLILLLIALLVLVVIGAVALYIAFEPEKLEMLRQYLKSSTNHSLASEEVLVAGTFQNRSEQWNDTWTEAATTKTSAIGNLTASTLLSADSPLPENSTASEAETEATSPASNATRYCDDCLSNEVCVALVDEEVPTCRAPRDPRDPTGCAGFCLINKQKCHRLDVDAFRCVEMEHYCLDDEWTCINTLCIPLEKHCDGHMNCYDHSDEQNCVCDLETHFQCGNETSCLPLEKRCDGKIDCWDATDEINCTLGRNLACPSENEFTCSNGQCILRARFCDNLPDCLDGSDEPHGCQGRCNKHEFTCQNSRCITKGMKCNGVDDCGDGTDERHCKERFS